MRHPVADQIAAASGNDGELSPGILLDHRALERIDLVADENGDGQGNLQCFEPSQDSRLIDVNASSIIEL
jgi:hypothetical protein